MFERVKEIFSFVDPILEYQIFVGLNDQDLHRQIIDDGAAVAWIGREFPEGCTITSGRGFYCGEQEKSLIVTVYAAKSAKTIIHRAAENIRAAFNQKQVIVTCAKARKTYWIG